MGLTKVRANQVYGVSGMPKPRLRNLVPDSNLPSNTGNFVLLGSFFTPDMTVVFEGQTVNSITFVDDNEVLVNLTTGATEGQFDITLTTAAGTSIYPDALLIVLGTVFAPDLEDWTVITEPIKPIDDGLELKTFDSRGRAEWNANADVAKDFEIKWNFKKSALHTDITEAYRNNDRVIIKDNTDDSVLFTIEKERQNRIEVFIGGTIYNHPEFTAYGTVSMKFIGGIWYLYKGSTVIRTFTQHQNYANNLKIEGSLRYSDIQNLKYIELAT